MRCSQSSVQRKIYNYKCLYEKRKKNSNKKPIFYFKKLGVGARKNVIKNLSKQKLYSYKDYMRKKIK